MNQYEHESRETVEVAKPKDTPVSPAKPPGRNGGLESALTAATVPDLRGRIGELIAVLGQGLHERQAALKAALLAAIAGENTLFLGLPGTAKSLLARRIRAAFREPCGYFEYLMTRFTTPDEVFGPVSIRAMRDEDAYRRKTESFLSSAKVAFLDEIFKASSAILNSLLTLMNERVFFNGSIRETAPLMTVIGASNEIPEKGQGLDALFDRFLVRYRVDPLAEKEAFWKMASGPARVFDPTPSPAAQLTERDLEELRRGAETVAIPPEVRSVVDGLRASLHDKLEQEGAKKEGDPGRYYVSDRRWKKAIGLMRVNAFANGRRNLALSDCALLASCLWNRPEDAEGLRLALNDVFERALTGVDASLDVASFERRHKDLLEQMIAYSGAANLRPAGKVIKFSDGAPDRTVSDDDYTTILNNDFESVRRTGLFYDESNSVLRKVTVHKKGFITLANQLCANAQTFGQFLSMGYLPTFENVTVTVEDLNAPGARIDLSSVHPRNLKLWLEDAAEILRDLHGKEELRQRLLDNLSEEIESELFLEPSDLEGLKAGLERAGLIITEWTRKVEELKGQIERRGAFETMEVEGPNKADAT